MNINFYINYDFGLRGDYKGLYKWLDKNKAEERGNCYALIKKYNFPDSELSGITDNKEKIKKLVFYLREEIKTFVTIEPSDRIYLTFKVFESGNLGGIFVFGQKQSSPWEGHYLNDNEPEIDYEF
ncbi:hypothetical protein [Labilibaculum euxinus]